MTRRSSLRAAAREIYKGMGEGEAALAQAPTPDPSPRIASARGAGEQDAAPPLNFSTPDLTAQAKSLYEDSAVPVREIAAAIGVTERTIYKYVRKHGWKRRYVRVVGGNAVARDEASADAGRHRQRAEGLAAGIAPVKGAGGRFIRREDEGKPFATGLKATDPAGRSLALAATAEASRRGQRARVQAELRAVRAAQVRAIATTSQALTDWAELRKEIANRLATRAAPEGGKARSRTSGRPSPRQSWAHQPSGEPSKHLTRHPAGPSVTKQGRGPSALQQRLEQVHAEAVEAALRCWRFLVAREQSLVRELAAEPGSPVDEGKSAQIQR